MVAQRGQMFNFFKGLFIIYPKIKAFLIRLIKIKKDLREI
jgi:hypothetical protein